MSFRTRFGRGICLAVTLSTVLVAQVAVQAAPGTRADFPRTDDVSLQANGELRGQLLDPQGRPLALTQVALLRGHETIGVAKTDLAGQFVIRDLQPGAYHIETAVAGKSVRLWSAQAAPPAARPAVLLVADGDIARAKGKGASFDNYGPAMRGAIAGGLVTGLVFWALDYNAAS